MSRLVAAASGAAILATAATSGRSDTDRAFAHQESVVRSDAQQFVITKGRTPVDTKFRLFAQKATVTVRHTHLGSGRKMCITLRHRVYTGYCGTRLSSEETLDYSSGWSCKPDWSDVFGTVSREVAEVRVRFEEADTVSTTIYKSPKGLGFKGRFFLAFGDRASRVTSVEALDENGGLLKFSEGPDTRYEPCEAASLE